MEGEAQPKDQQTLEEEERLQEEEKQRLVDEEAEADWSRRPPTTCAFANACAAAAS